MRSLRSRQWWRRKRERETIERIRVALSNGPQPVSHDALEAAYEAAKMGTVEPNMVFVSEATVETIKRMFPRPPVDSQSKK